MIAPVKLVARDATLRTIFAIVIFLPLQKFVVVGPTASLRVRLLTTLETHLLPTLATDGSLLENAGLFDVVHAARPRTPHQIRIQVHIDVQLELQVLLVDLFLAEHLDVFLSECLRAAHHHTRDVHDVAIFHVHHQMVF